MVQNIRSGADAFSHSVLKIRSVATAVTVAAVAEVEAVRRMAGRDASAGRSPGSAADQSVAAQSVVLSARIAGPFPSAGTVPGQRDTGECRVDTATGPSLNTVDIEPTAAGRAGYNRDIERLDTVPRGEPLLADFLTPSRHQRP